MLARAQALLKEVFGYESFRPLQREILQNLFDKKDALVIMPTGGGKSLCYQLPALVFEGLTVVVSPLISLMKDQVEQLRQFGIPAIFLNSSLSFDEYQHNIARLQKQEIKLLYVAPETLLKDKTLALLSSLPIACLAIDEAHCISEWGHDFRPDYRQIAGVRPRFPQAVCVALTATATPRVQDDIQKNLRFAAAQKFVASFNRENLFIRIIPKSDPFAQTHEFLRQFPDQPGIIYCFSRKQVDDLADALKTEGYSAKPYHAGLPEIDRRQNQEAFLRDDAQIIVATIAFGMGINKSNVRFVVHYDLPKSLESYYQEIGRAGRDGVPAQCLLLFSYADVYKIKYLIDQKPDEQERRVAHMHLNALLRYVEAENCRRIPLLAYFGEKFGHENCAQCDNCTSSKKVREDLTIAAQKFLSCVGRTGQKFGANHIIDVLRGSHSEKILKFGHGNLSTYGIGKDLSKAQWLHLARQLIQKELLQQDPEFGSLILAPKAREVLRGDEKFWGVLQAERVDYSKEEAGGQDYDRALFEILRQKRKEMADALGVPPYVIFPDKTLIEMAKALPPSRAEMLQLHGVGEVKFQKYGQIFLDIIARYCLGRRNFI